MFYLTRSDEDGRWFALLHTARTGVELLGWANTPKEATSFPTRADAEGVRALLGQGWVFEYTPTRVRQQRGSMEIALTPEEELDEGESARLEKDC